MNDVMVLLVLLFDSLLWVWMAYKFNKSEKAIYKDIDSIFFVFRQNDKQLYDIKSIIHALEERQCHLERMFIEKIISTQASVAETETGV